MTTDTSMQNLSEPRGGENDVEAGTFGSRVPVRDFLFLPWISDAVLKPPMERVRDIVVALGDTSTNGTPGGMLAPVVAMDEATDCAVGPSMVTNPGGAFKLLDPEAPAQGRAEITVIHWRGSLFRDEVCTRFGARPK